MPSPISLSVVVCLSVALSAPAQQSRKPVNPPAAPGGAATKGTAQQTVELLLAAAQRGDAIAFWDWLPSNYQQDVEGIVQLLAQRVDPATYDRGWQLVRRIATVAVDKQQFVFGNQQFAAMLAQGGRTGSQRGGNASDDAQAVYGAATKLMQSLADSDLATHDGLAAFDMRAFAKQAGKPTFDLLFAMVRAKGDDAQQILANTVVDTVEQDDGEATIRLSAPGQPPETGRLVLHDGRWLPAEMVRGWSKNVQQLKERIQALPVGHDAKSKQQLHAVFGMVEGFVKKFEQAETQQEFDHAIAEVMAFAGRGRGAQQHVQPAQRRSK